MFRDVEEYLNISKDDWINENINKLQKEFDINDSNIDSYYNKLKVIMDNNIELLYKRNGIV